MEVVALTGIDNDYFLHFLDRELLETHGVYNSLLEQAIIKDVRSILFSTCGDLIVSASFLFESKYAYAVFREFYPLFVSGKFTIALTYDSVKKMIAVKQDQYRGREKAFPNYFNDLWHILQENGITLVPKREDTTLYIASGMLHKVDYDSRIESKENIPYIIEVIEERNKKAITHHLFEVLYLTREVPVNDQDAVNSLITELYIKSYMEYFDATIATGLGCGIFKYDYLSTNFPLSDIPFWNKLYKRMGIYRFVCTCKASTIIEIVNSHNQSEFLQITANWLRCYANQKGERFLFKTSDIYPLVNLLPKFDEILVEDINAYFQRLNIVKSYMQSPQKVGKKGSVAMQSKESTVFVVHGRSNKIKTALFAFLRSLSLKPLEWESAVGMTGKGAPTTLEVIEAGMKNSGGTLILFTGDDLAKLREELWNPGESFGYEFQPRQNVLFEAGMAMALHPESTIIVRVGVLREISDLAGVNYINLSDTPEQRNALAARLKTIGLHVDTSGSDWLSAGDFTV